MNKMTKILALVLALLMVVPMALACKGDKNDPTKAPDGTNDPSETETPVDDKEYTYNLSMGSTPSTWNPHTWETNADSAIMSYLETPLVDVTIGEDGGFMWVYEMATEINDITATYADREKWLPKLDENGMLSEDGEYPTEHFIYEIKLNPDATWENGTPINADTYIYSMQQCISSEMKNYRASSYMSGEIELKNGANYFNNDLVGYPIMEDVIVNRDKENVYTYHANFTTEAEAYVTVDNPVFFFGGSMKAYYEGGYQGYFTADDGTDYYTVIADYIAENDAADGFEDGYAIYSDELFEALDFIRAKFNDSFEEAWKEFLVVQNGSIEETPWEDVGLIKVDDYTLIYVLENSVTPFYFHTNMTSNWLVYEELYEAGKETIENLTTTDYGTNVDNYIGYGPYKLTSFETNKQFILDRNENWYGYSDGKHEGQYQTTKVVYDIVTEHATALMLFQQGKLDEVDITADDMQDFRASENLLKTDQTYTYRYIFATDVDALEQLENDAGDGSNKRILSYDDFRKAISLSINRDELCAQATPGYKPAYYLLNSLYYYDVENDTNSVYRNTDEAKEAVLRLYGIEYGAGTAYETIDDAYAAVTGYDVEEARRIFEEVATQAIADGLYTEGQDINITCYATASQSLSTDYQTENEMLNEYIAEATKGTKLEGKINVTYVAGIENRYADVALGRVEMARGAWGGAAFYPFSTIRVYCEPDYMGGADAIHESCGFDPTTESFSIEIDGETITKTFQDWAKSINDSQQYANYPDKCLLILSHLESNILGAYSCIPFACDVVVSMYSNQIQYATLDYDIMYGYGGIRLMTYTMDDAAWEAYVAENGGEIDYK